MAKKTTTTTAAKGSKFVQFNGLDGPVFVDPAAVAAVLPQASGGALITTNGGNDVRVEESPADVVAALAS